MRLFVMTVAGYAMVVAAMIVASEGRAIEILRACSGGGGTWSDLTNGPMRMLAGATLMPIPSTVLLTFGFAALASSHGQVELRLPRLLLASTTLVTFIILGAPGTDYNHLLDLNVVCIVMLVAWLTGPGKAQARFGVYLLAFATLMTLPMLEYHLEKDDRLPRRQQFQSVLRASGESPILSENPLLNVDAGQRPYVLDPFLFRTLNQRDPRYAESLWEKLSAQVFGAVVLEVDPRSEMARRWYHDVHYGPRFLEELEKSYYFAAIQQEQFVYLPRAR